jgi:predicted  nucleic acid-binding Zn-ribbon protein
MKVKKYIIILPLLCWAFGAEAQVPEGMSSMPEQWQLTLDVIKSKAQTLVVQNNGLKTQYRQLTGRERSLQRSIAGQQYKNEQISRFLKERHGLTDQQLQIGKLTQIIKAKRQEARSFDEQLKNLKRDQSALYNNSLQSKDENSDLKLAQWRKELEDENRQEALLDNELKTLKSGNNAQNLNESTIIAQNRDLEARLGILRTQRERYLKKYSGAQLAQASARRYDELKKRKDELEAYISVYELRMDQLRGASLMAMSWDQKRKKLVHEMVQTDARNNKMRDKIKGLHEDIDILRDQVAKLESRLDSVKARGKP